MSQVSTAATPLRRRSLAHVSSAVFGEPYPPTLQGLPRAALLVALVLVGTVIVLLRIPRSLWNLLWAEDGAVFVSEALRGGLEVVVSGYAGYMHFVPRLAAEFAVLAPLQIVPVAVTVLAAGVIALLACACFVFLETRIRAIPLRFSAWLVCLALPTMGGDVTGNLANLHWFLLIAAFCAVMVRSRSIAFTAVQAAVVFGAATSDALALLLAPLVIARWWLAPARRDRVVVLAYALGAAMQIVTVVNGLLGTGPARQIASEHPSFASLLDLYVHRSVLIGLLGLTGAEHALEVIGTALPGLALAGVIVAIVFAARADAGRRVGVIVFAVSSAGFAGIVYSLQWYAIELTPVTEFFTGLRYAVVPTALLLLALVQALDIAVGHARTRRVEVTLAVLGLIAVLVPVALDFRATIGRESPSWRDALAHGVSQCAGGLADDEGLVVIPTPPLPFGGMLIPCTVITDGD